jgi:carbonic anhydrase/acetyltransferase-like protein (isoleucine patch superfamily)
MSKTNKKYELIEAPDNAYKNAKIYRIKALRDFGTIQKGDLGGFIESEFNLSHEGNCWIHDSAYVINEARVYEDALVCSDAWVFDNAEIYGHAIISGEANIYHHAKVYDNAKVYGYARVYNSAQIYEDAIIHGNARVKGTMKATKPVTVVDNSEVIITIADNKIHVYQSTVYTEEELPDKYRGIIGLKKTLAQ